MAELQIRYPLREYLEVVIAIGDFEETCLKYAPLLSGHAPQYVVDLSTRDSTRAEHRKELDQKSNTLLETLAKDSRNLATGKIKDRCQEVDAIVSRLHATIVESTAGRGVLLRQMKELADHDDWITPD